MKNNCLFVRRDRKDRRRVKELVDLGIDALIYTHVHRDPLKAGFHQQLHIPLRAMRRPAW